MVSQSAHVLTEIGSPPFRADPYPTYARLRACGPVIRDESLPVWHVVGYREVQAGLREPHLSAARSGYFLSPAQRRDYGALAEMLPAMMVFVDPPSTPGCVGW